MSSSKVLIISLQGIGDTILALPAIKRYAERNSSQVSVVVSKPGLKNLLSRFDFINEVYIWDEHKSFLFNIINLKSKLNNLCFDNVFAVDPNGRRDNLLLFFIRSRNKISFRYKGAFLRMLYFLNPDSISRNSEWHDAEANMRLFGFDNIHIRSIDLKSIISEEERSYALKVLSKRRSSFFITLHPGSLSGVKGKRWPPENYSDICNRLVDKFNCRFVLIGGKEELNLRNEIGKKIKNDPIVLQNETLSQTIAFMNETHFFIGNDSGPMHMAAALDLPMFVFLGCVDCTLISPLSNNCLLVRKNIPCSPCYNFLKTIPRKCEFDFHCINGIDVDNVFLILKHYLNVILFNEKAERLEDISNFNFVDSLTKMKNGPLLTGLKAN